MKSRIRQEKDTTSRSVYAELFEKPTPEAQQYINGAMEKRTVSWLLAMPILSH